jgi:phosphatidylglycerophosphate synthase
VSESNTTRRSPRAERVIRVGALAVGVVLFAVALYYINFHTAISTIGDLGVALPLALLFSGLWHLVRTWAWAWCFPATEEHEPRKNTEEDESRKNTERHGWRRSIWNPAPVSFARLARVRLAAEAFSYLTLRGIAGEPLKVVLLGDMVDARQATAAVALERIAYVIVTTWIVGVGSILAIIGLPLSHAWFRVFRAFAIAAGVVALMTAAVLAGRGTYLQSWILRIDRWFGTSVARGRVMRFVASVERQMLQLLRGDPARLGVLLIATVAAYVCMALEAWVILRATGAAVSLNGALAVETFSRVASFASAFIPANLGALEASSLAAVAAIGAVSGGAALALARRLRGLFWAAIGLAIYPRRAKRSDAGTSARPAPAPGKPPHTLLYFPVDASVSITPSARLAGLPIAERVLSPARRAGYTRILVWLPAVNETSVVIRRLARSIGDITLVTSHDQWREVLRELCPGDAVTVVGPGSVVSTALLERARDLPIGSNPIRDVPAGADYRVSGVVRITVEAAASPDDVQRLLADRRNAIRCLPSGEEVSNGVANLALRLTTPADLVIAERTIRRASYKNTDATLARFNRSMSLPVSIALIPTPITANQLSLLLVAIGFYAAWLFSTGHYVAGVLGAFLSLAASILDGCDGEIARLKYQESALGCWIETFGDYSYYIAIFVGLTVGAVRQTGWETLYWLGGIALTGTLLSFALLIYLRNRITAGQPEKLHDIAKTRFKAVPSCWSRIVWRISFVATRSTMPYGIMALALVDALPVVVILAAVGANIYWISLMVKLRHLLGTEQAVTA